MSWADKITATCYKCSFGAQFVVVLKYMVKEINTKVKRYFRWKINGCYVLATSYLSMGNINNGTVISNLKRKKYINIEKDKSKKRKMKKEKNWKTHCQKRKLKEKNEERRYVKDTLS